MKNILIIAYYYPPKGGAGVQRSAKLAKYLNKLGYKVHVLTVEKNIPGIIDESLMVDIHENIRVYRTGMKKIISLDFFINKFRKKSNVESIIKPEQNPPKQKTFINFIKRIIIDFFLILNIPDDKKGWINYAIKEGNKIIKEQNIDLIYSTSAPTSAHFIGRKLKEKNSIPWIADFRDSWADNKAANYNTIIRFIYGKLEKQIIYKADKIISVSKPIVDNFSDKYISVAKSKFHVIPNGYDEDDFVNLDLKKHNSNEKFEILYNGTLYANEDPSTFFIVLHNLINMGKLDTNKILIKFNGDMGAYQREIVNYYSSIYPGVICQNNYKNHAESIRDFESANALLLILGEGKGVEGVYSGKIFEYIRANKPIIGIVPNGVARDLIIDSKTGYTATASDTNRIQEILLELYSNFIGNKNNQVFNPRWEVIEQFSRESLTKKLVAISESLK